MTSYTTSLRLWQGTPGDPAIKDQWAPPLNENDNLIEAAITDTVQVDLTGLTTYSLTVSNGGADQSRPLVQQYINTPGGNCTVTLPNVPKIGYAQNSTTGGFNVILTTGAGTTATIPADGFWHLYSADGAGNVSLPSVLFGPPSAPGAFQGTSGTFSGPVSMTALTATTGTFSGAVAANAGVVLPNAVAISGSVNPGGAPQALIGLSSANRTQISAGAGGVQFFNSINNTQTGLIDTSGNASFPGQVSASTAAFNGAVTGLNFTVTTNGQAYYGKDTSNTARPILSIDAGNFTNIYNGGAQRVRIFNQAGTREFFGVDNSGNVTISAPGVPSPITNSTTGSSWNVNTGWDINVDGSITSATIKVGTSHGSGILQTFYTTGVSQVGSIVVSGAGVVYNTTSDQRLKAGRGPLDGHHSGGIIDRLRPKWFTWLTNPDADPEPGFFAQQVHRVFPWAVRKGKGKPGSKGFEPWQMDAGKLIPVIVAELQSLRLRVAELERR